MLETEKDNVVVLGGEYGKMLIINAVDGAKIKELADKRLSIIRAMLLLKKTTLDTATTTTASTTTTVATKTTTPLLIGDSRGVLVLWDLDAGKALRIVRTERNKLSRGVKALVQLENGSVACALGPTVEVWDVVSRQLLFEICGSNEHSASLMNGLVELEGGLIATGSSDKRVKVWNTREGDGSIVRGFKATKGAAVSHLLRLKSAVDWSEEPVLCTGDGRTLHVWRLTHPKKTLLATFEAQNKIDCIVELKKGRVLVTTKQGTAEVFKLRTR